MLDKYEPWSRRTFHSWRPDASAGLLIGFPFSPLVYASRRLAEREIPYVVDAGDTWVLTSARPEARAIGRLRARRAELRLWDGAAGAVVTTDAQARALASIFPQLPILVRPNGFATNNESPGEPLSRRPSRSDSCLRLVHFGDISSDRVEIAGFLRSLARSDVWSEVEFHQYGSDWTGSLAKLREVGVTFHHPRPWREVVAAAAADYDLAVVIGNRDSMLLPSKAVAYLQLPIPRLALVDDDADNELTRYIDDKPGWTVLSVRAPDGAQQIRGHLSRRWTSAELAPPATESWANVSQTVRRFLDTVFGKPGSAMPHDTQLETSRWRDRH